MSQERKTYPKEFKVMSVELSNTRTDLSALAKELDGGRSFLANKAVVFLEMGKSYSAQLSKSWLY